MPARRILAATVAVALLPLGSVACSSQVKTGQGAVRSFGALTPRTEARTSTGAAASGDSTPPADASDPTAGAGSAAGASSLPSAGSVPAGFCAVLSGFVTQLQQMDGQTQPDLGQLRTDLGQLQQSAPAELTDDVREVASVLGPIAAGDATAASQLETPAFGTAVEHLGAWATAHCK